jgi:1,4-alpha-glucan branching enzyme
MRIWAGIAVILLFAACTPPPAGGRSPELGPEGVVFRFRAPAARVVQVAGSWDSNSFLRGLEWTSDTRVGLMQDGDHDGTWELVVPLGPGRYEYLFLVDGKFWELDPANPQRVADGAGGERSLLVVP